MKELGGDKIFCIIKTNVDIFLVQFDSHPLLSFQGLNFMVGLTSNSNNSRLIRSPIKDRR